MSCSLNSCGGPFHNERRHYRRLCTRLAACLVRFARRCGKCSCACTRCRALGVRAAAQPPSLTAVVRRYRPADQDPAKESFNSRAGRHPLGHRARKLDQGILVVRFELPFNIWCDACHNHIGQGVRYNAEKKQVGSYYTTPIWSFRCKCHLCQNWFEIRTDPQVRGKCLCFIFCGSPLEHALHCCLWCPPADP